MDQSDDIVQTPAAAESPEVEAEVQSDPPVTAQTVQRPRRGAGVMVALLSGFVTAAVGFAGGVLLVQRYPELLGLTGGAGVDQRISDHDKRLSDLAAQLAGSVAGALAGVVGGAATGFVKVAYQGAHKTNKVLRELLPPPKNQKDVPSSASSPTRPQENSQPEKAKSPETSGNAPTASESAK